MNSTEGKCKMNINKPTLCIYHDSCLDGFGSAWSVWKKFGNDVRFEACSYNSQIPDVTNEHVVIVDFSFKKDIILTMVEKAKSVTILDHHKTAQEDLCELLSQNVIQGVFNLNESGAVITWKYYNPDKYDIPKLLLYIQDQDLWEFKLSSTKEINAYISILPYDFSKWDLINDLIVMNKQTMIGNGAIVVRKQLKDIEYLLKKTSRKMMIGSYYVQVANMSNHQTSLASEHFVGRCSFFAGYIDTPDGRLFSLRSNKDYGIDVSEIAKIYGGGGHKNAAGFMVKFKDLERLGLL